MVWWVKSASWQLMPPRRRSSARRQRRKCARREAAWLRPSRMNSKPPFVRQERPDTCAIACLRRILAYQGRARSEADVVQSAAMQPSGLDPEGLAQLAQRYGLHAVEQQLDQQALSELIRQQRFPIVFLYRRLI